MSSEDGSPASKSLDFFLRRLRRDDPNARAHWAFRLGVSLGSVLLLLLAWQFLDKADYYRIGFPAPGTYLAVSAQRYVDREATEQLRAQAGEQIAAVWVQDEGARRRIERELERLRDTNAWTELPESLASLLAGLSEARRKAILETAAAVGGSVARRLSPETDRNALIWKYLAMTPLSQADRNVAYQILDAVLEPTLLADESMTAHLREEAIASIRPIVRQIEPGSVLVRKGQIVTEQIGEVLRRQGYPEAKFPLVRILFVFIAVLGWSFWATWLEQSREIRITGREWAFVGFILFFSWGLLLLLSRFRIESLLTLPLAGCLFLTLPSIFSFHLALGGGILGALIAFAQTPGTLALQVILSGVAAGLGYMLLRDLQNRIAIWRNLFLLGLILSVVGIIIRIGIGLPANPSLFAASLVAAAAWSSLVIAFLPLFENVFDVNSPLRLIELSHPSNPLLRRLMIEAPGTYHHSLMVGVLAEAAADRLGLNSLAVRAGAYYHDIGKLRRPRYFIENQIPGENVHDGLSPTLSALAILSHVRDGLRIAEERGIPRLIRRFIPEHHGTTVLDYFYRKARSQGVDVGIEQFTYPGPRPQSRETALVMLADSVEAAVKASGGSLEDPGELEKLVADVVESKILGRQLEDVDFTLRDLSEIRRAFVEVLRSMRHGRQVRKIPDPAVPAEGAEHGREIAANGR